MNRSTRSSGGTLALEVQSTESEGSIACKYWKHNLKESGWRLSAGGRDDWRFIPVQYGVKNMSELKKAGAEEGEHFAEGWLSLYFMLQKYGKFSPDKVNDFGRPLLIDYKGPDLPPPRIQTTGARQVSLSPPSRSTTVNSFVNLCSPEEPKIDHIPFEDLGKMKIEIHQGSQDLKETLTSSLTEEVWGHGGNNPIPYRHLEAVLANDKNYIFVGSLNGKICSLFVYEFTGLKEIDATIRVYWTKHEYRNKGFVTKLMHEGLCFLVDDAVLHSGSTSSHGSLVCRSQGFHEYSTGNFSSVISSLRKHIESSITKKVTGDNNVDFHFGFKLSDINMHNDGNDIIAIYEGKRYKKESPKSSTDRKRSYDGSEIEPQDAKEKRLKTSTGRNRSHDASQVGSNDEKEESMQRSKTLQEKERKLESKLKTLQEEENVLENKFKKEDDERMREHLFRKLERVQCRIEKHEDWLDDIHSRIFN